LQRRIRMSKLIEETVAAYASKNWVFLRLGRWRNGRHLGSGPAPRRGASLYPSLETHGFLGASGTRASNSARPGAPAAPAGAGGRLLKLE
jgi:hypothetical protein